MNLEDFEGLELSTQELEELQGSYSLLQAALAEQEPALPENLTGAALLHLLDGVEQIPEVVDPPILQQPQEKHLFMLFPKRYAAAVAMLAVAVAVGFAYNRLPRTDLLGDAGDNSMQEMSQISTLQAPVENYAEILEVLQSRQNETESETASVVSENQQMAKVQDTEEGFDTARPDSGWAAPSETEHAVEDRAPSPFRSVPEEDAGRPDSGAGQAPLMMQAVTSSPVISTTTAAGNDYQLEMLSAEEYVVSIFEADTGEQVGILELDNNTSYCQLLSHEDKLVAVGNLKQYPEEYMQLGHTVLDELGQTEPPALADNRNDYTEMSTLSIYALSEDATQPVLTRQHYQAGTYLDAAISSQGTLLTVSSKRLYQEDGVAGYLTEALPVVYTAEKGFDYLPHTQIYRNDELLAPESYTVISSCNLNNIGLDFETVAYLGSYPETVQITDSGVYLAQVLDELTKTVTKVVKFAADNVSSLFQSESVPGGLYGTIYELSTGHSVVFSTQDHYTGGGIQAVGITVFDPRLAIVSQTVLELDSGVPFSLAQQRDRVVVDTLAGTCTVDFSDPEAPAVIMGKRRWQGAE